MNPNRDAGSVQLDKLIREKIELLRPKLLDLTGRNPLIRTRLTARSSSHIRIVDEIPDRLLSGLVSEQGMELVPLPDLDDELPDEKTRAFRSALAAARKTDQEYLEAAEKIDRDDPDSMQQMRAVEQTLRDRVRSALNLPPRSTGKEINLIAHARNHGINPSYDLPEASSTADDGRHSDDLIQTLQLPKELERRMNGVLSKARTWEQETGVNVLQAAIGFLEWAEGDGRGTNFAPLIILPLAAKAEKTTNGRKFRISAAGEPAELNGVLVERLRRDFGLNLPAFGGGSVDEFLAEVKKLNWKGVEWRVRRQAVVGIFPSAKIAMFHDLDTHSGDFTNRELVRSMLLGSGDGSQQRYGEDYDLDPALGAGKIPVLVDNADSSQISTLIDVAEGKNIAVEGPPGTGKSQTIVNAIAGALARGEKVLFVAEKTAALDVVKSRLEAADLGEFILPLQAGKASKDQVIQSIAARLDLGRETAPKDLEAKQKALEEARVKLADYAALLRQDWSNTGFSIHEVLGANIKLSESLQRLSPLLLSKLSPKRVAYTKQELEQIQELVARVAIEQDRLSQDGALWKESKLASATAFELDELLALAQAAKETSDRINATRKSIREIAPKVILSGAAVEELLKAVVDAGGEARTVQLISTNLPLLDPDGASRAREVLADCKKAQDLAGSLSAICNEPLDSRVQHLLTAGVDAAGSFGIDSVNVQAAEEVLAEKKRRLESANTLRTKLQAFLDQCPEAAKWELRVLAKVKDLGSTVDPNVLGLRHRALYRDSARQELRGLIANGMKIRTQWEDVATKLRVSPGQDRAVITNMISVFQGSGFFSFLSKEFRRTKAEFAALNLRGSFSRQSAIEDLTAYAGSLTERRRFEEDDRAGVLFGSHFNGLQTDFSRFGRLLSFLDEVDHEFGTPDLAGPADFLKSGSAELIGSLSALPTPKTDLSIDALKNLPAEIAAEISVLNSKLASLSEAARALQSPEPVSLQKASAIAGDIGLLVDLRNKLDSINCSDLLGEDWAGSKTSVNCKEGFFQLMNRFDGVPFASELCDCAIRGTLTDLLGFLAFWKSMRDEQEELIARLEKRGQLSIDRNACLSPGFTDELERASKSRESLVDRVRLNAERRRLEEFGVDEAFDVLREAGVSVQDLPECVAAIVLRNFGKQVHQNHHSILSECSGARLNDLRKQFSELDRASLKLARKSLRAKLIAGARPDSGNSVGRKADYTEMGLLNHEVSKTRRHVPVRDLTRRAGKSLLELKPCWMMSPLAVAQYVPKNSVEFDLCIIDEASQMPPEDAIGALYRARRTMIVGDTKQLPPTTFFQKLLDDEEENDAADNVTEESILEIANATFRPARRLRWHYRSKHSGLIRFSNATMYNDDLIVFPSPNETRADLGVSLVKVEGSYKSGLNQCEARAVVDYAVEYMARHPERSLGVVALNKQQADFMREVFENEILPSSKIAQNYTEQWIARNDGLESFFIKNLENVQGDERDAILISTVYGPETPGGPVMQRFGPVNGVAGQRRLNVLFSRAKMQIVTFSSMTAADIRADETGTPGAYMLKRWLEYSATGLLAAKESTGRSADSPFEEFVAKQIVAMGCEAVPQVGAVGYFIDIGVKHPEWPHGFLLGVECDGAMYHSAKSVRDRDRLRQEVLEGHGWFIYRIWSTDWFSDPRAEAAKLRSVIEQRLKDCKSKSHFSVSQSPAAPSAQVARSPSATSIATLTAAAREASRSKENAPAKSRKPADDEVCVGDQVRVRFLSGDKPTLVVRISAKQGSQADKGVIGEFSPLGQALIGLQEGDEFEFLSGSYIKAGILEKIVEKGNAVVA